MAVYEYGRIKVLATKLTESGVSQNMIDQIMAGGDLIRKGDKPEKKAAWMKLAMDRMDTLLDEAARHSIRESCACCLGGKRHEISSKIGKTAANLEDAIKAANDAKFVFGNSVTLQEDGKIRVAFEEDGKESYRCVCLPKAKEPMSDTYCYCCGGHIKHHLQNALNRKLSCQVQSTALTSGGKTPCSFLYTIEE